MGLCQGSEYHILESTPILIEKQIYSTYDTVKIDESGYLYHLYNPSASKHIYGNISDKQLNGFINPIKVQEPGKDLDIEKIKTSKLYSVNPLSMSDKGLIF